VIIKESYRKYKLGHQLMQDGIDYIESMGETEIRISAQEHLRKFYERLGFEKVGEMYLEDDIPHIQMFKI
jgi:ElaA protein